MTLKSKLILLRSRIDRAAQLRDAAACRVAAAAMDGDVFPLASITEYAMQRGRAEAFEGAYKLILDGKAEA